ncbi:protein serine/threonine phosphatase [Pseudomonas sp. FEN]|nr:protein serine/threonine phosphatase [Pseudomonas sp. FEN]
MLAWSDRSTRTPSWNCPAPGSGVVADGMGGHAAGDYVSSLIVDTLRRVPPSDALAIYTTALRTRLAEVNAAVREETANRGVAMMGSTVVLLAVRGAEGVCLWAGDSRLYRLRDGQLESISRDHSYVQDLQDSGLLSEAEARVHPRANIVTRASAWRRNWSCRWCRSRCCRRHLPTVQRRPEQDRRGRRDPRCAGARRPYDVVRSLVHLGLTRGAPDNLRRLSSKPPEDPTPWIF